MINGDFIFFQGLLFLILFHVIGHPIVNVFLRRPNIPHKLVNLDSIQRLPIEFITGGALIYLVTLITTPFHGFNVFACWIVTGIATVFYLYQHLKGLDSFKKPSTYSWIALAIFTITLAIRAIPVSNFVLGSNQDISWHTLLTYSIIRDGGIPFSVIEGYVLQVPVGVHTNLAFFSLISGIPAEVATFQMLVFLSSLIGLAAYLFGSIIGSQKFGLYACLVMMVISFYPSAITWGSAWLVFGLSAFFVTFSLVISFGLKNLQLNTSGLVTILFPGLITGFLAAAYIPLYIICIITSILVLLLGRTDILRKLRQLITTFLLGIPLFALSIYRYFFMSQTYSDFVAQQVAATSYYAASNAASRFIPISGFSSPIVIFNTIGNWLTWDAQNGWSGALAFFPLIIAGAILLSYYLVKHKLKGFDALIPRYVLAIIIIVILWGLNSPLGFFNITDFGLGIMMTELDKIAVIVGTVLLPFVAAYALTSVDDFATRITKTYRRLSKAVSTCIILLVLLTSFAMVPSTNAWLVGNYKIFSTATESDYELLKWMHSEIPLNSNVLVNPEDAGQYVPSIGGQRALFIGSTGVKFLSKSYYDLYSHIRDRVFNRTTVELFRQLKVDYVFVGARAYEIGGWDAIYFLRNPWYFRLVHNVSSSYLFAVETSSNSTPLSITRKGYLGFSSNQTSIDFKNMMVQDLVTSESIYIEIVLKNKAGYPWEIINHWNPPKLILSPEIDLVRKTDFTIVGSFYSFNLSLSTMDNDAIGILLSAEYPSPQSSISVSLFPLYNITQHSLRLSTNNENNMLLSNQYSLRGVSPTGTTYFEIISATQKDLHIFNDYIYTQSQDSLNFVLRTSPVG